MQLLTKKKKILKTALNQIQKFKLQSLPFLPTSKSSKHPINIAFKIFFLSSS